MWIAPAASTTASASTASPFDTTMPVTAPPRSNATRSTVQSVRTSNRAVEFDRSGHRYASADVTRRPARRVSGVTSAPTSPSSNNRSTRPSSTSAGRSTGIRLRCQATSTSSHPHARYRAGSPRSATIALTALDPPTPRPRRYRVSGPLAVRRAVRSSWTRPSTASAAKQSSPSIAGGTSPGSSGGPDSTSTTWCPASQSRRAATHPPDPAPTTIHFTPSTSRRGAPRRRRKAGQVCRVVVPHQSPGLYGLVRRHEFGQRRVQRVQ